MTKRGRRRMVWEKFKDDLLSLMVTIEDNRRHRTHDLPRWEDDGGPPHPRR